MHPRHRLFVEEYLVDLNGKQAAIRAGYKPSEAASRASKLLARADIKAAVRHSMEERIDRTRVSQDRVIQEYARIAFADFRDIIARKDDVVTIRPPEELSDDAAAAIQSLSIWGESGRAAVRLHSKERALFALGRHTGMFDTRHFPDPKARNADRGRTREALLERIAALLGRGPAEAEEEPAKT